VLRGLALDEHEQAFLLGDRVMPDPFRNDEHFTFGELDIPAFHLDPEAALEDEKELVFVVMTMPREAAVHLGDLDVGVVDLGDDARRPQFSQ
jgi:hypothetical protein